MVTCRDCGGNIPDDGRFCSYCGKPRSYITGNFAGSPQMANEIYLTSGTISTYSATGSIATAKAIEYPTSGILNYVVTQFKEKWSGIPDEFTQKIIQGEHAVKNFNEEIERRERAARITVLITNTNLMFQGKRGATLFRDDDLRLVSELHSPCCNEAEFVNKLARLAAIFEVRLAPLRALVSEHGELRSIALVEKWLEDNHITFNKEMLSTWKGIVALRNKAPLHADTNATELMEILAFFGAALPINYPKLWNAIVEKFTESLEMWQNLLSTL